MTVNMNCPVCDSARVVVFLTREGVPIRQNTAAGEKHASVDVPRGDLNLTVCERCGFVFNSTFDPTLPIYGQNYDNAQFYSQVFDEYLSNLIAYLINERGVQNCRVVEVGCGDGYFLKRLVEKGSNTGIGYDPSYVGPLEIMDGNVRFERSYYGTKQASVPADVVICRHVIEHVHRPLELLRSVRQALANSPSAYVFFETPTVEWILRNQTFWDFFYEHCSIFTAQSLTTAFQRSGFRVQRVQPAFGGQYLWMEAGLSLDNEKSEMTFNAGEIPTLALEFAKLEKSLKKNWQQQIEQLNAVGRVAIWGAGAKGVTFANLVDPNQEQIACVVDVNPRKQGHFLSGTGHPIVDYHTLQAHGVTTVILMNPNYYDEVAKVLRQTKQNVQILVLANELEEKQ